MFCKWNCWMIIGTSTRISHWCLIMAFTTKSAAVNVGNGEPTLTNHKQLCFHGFLKQKYQYLLQHCVRISKCCGLAFIGSNVFIITALYRYISIKRFWYLLPCSSGLVMKQVYFGILGPSRRTLSTTRNHPRCKKKAMRSTSIIHRCDTSMSDRCLVGVDLWAFNGFSP